MTLGAVVALASLRWGALMPPATRAATTSVGSSAARSATSRPPRGVRGVLVIFQERESQPPPSCFNSLPHQKQSGPTTHSSPKASRWPLVLRWWALGVPTADRGPNGV